MAKKRSTKKRVSALERRLLTLEREHRDLAKQIKKLTRRIDALPDATAMPSERGFPKGPKRGGPFRVPFAPPGGPAGGPGGRGRRTEFWPVVSLDVPLEADDPSAPLWATVTARLPEEITTVGDDGAIVRYRYSAVGSTPQAPRYRLVHEPSGPFPA